jgi:hypothetical protein
VGAVEAVEAGWRRVRILNRASTSQSHSLNARL